MPLRTPRHVERTTHLEEPTLVIERTHLRRIDVSPVRLVGDDGAIVPAIPQATDDIDELVGALIAHFMLVVFVKIKIERGPGVGTGDDVPRRAPAADMVDRTEHAGDIERLG